MSRVLQGRGRDRCRARPAAIVGTPRTGPAPPMGPRWPLRLAPAARAGPLRPGRLGRHAVSASIASSDRLSMFVEALWADYRGDGFDLDDLDLPSTELRCYALPRFAFCAEAGERARGALPRVGDLAHLLDVEP